MTANASGDPPPETTAADVAERAAARLVGRYFDPRGSVSEDDLRAALQKLVQGTIVDVSPGGFGITVVIERPTDERTDPGRDSYLVRQVTNLDSEPILHWSYLGPLRR